MVWYDMVWYGGMGMETTNQSIVFGKGKQIYQLTGQPASQSVTEGAA